MAYTNAWSTAIPLGSAAANTIDDAIRQARLDLGQRLLSVFDDLDDDPLVFKAAFITYLNSLIATGNIPDIQLHWSTGELKETSGDPITNVFREIGFVGPNGAAATLDWIVPLNGPVGGKFDTCSLEVYRDAAAVLTATLYKSNGSSDTTIVSDTSVSTGWHGLVLSFSEQTIGAGESYYVLVSMENNGAGTNFAKLQSVLFGHS